MEVETKAKATKFGKRKQKVIRKLIRKILGSGSRSERLKSCFELS